MMKLANSPTTDTADDIVVSLSGSFQLDFVVLNSVLPRFSKGQGATWKGHI